MSAFVRKQNVHPLGCKKSVVTDLAPEPTRARFLSVQQVRMRAL